MAFPYTVVFQNAGVIERYLIRSSSTSYTQMYAVQLPADIQAIIAQFGAGASGFSVAGGPVAGIDTAYASFQQQVMGWKTKLQKYVENVFTDPATVINNLNQALRSTDLKTIQQAIMQQMIDDAQSLKPSTVTIGSVTAASNNKGNGTVLADKVLDGFSAPLTGKGFSSLLYDGVNSELAVPAETMIFQCNQDSYTGGVAEGAERWNWTGGQAGKPWDWNPEGSGNGPGLITANQDTTVKNFSFDNWPTVGPPSNWTATPTGTTLIAKESSIVFRGGAALKITGDGATATLSLSQAITGNLTPRRRYSCSIQLRRGGTAPAAGTVTIQLTGTGYTSPAITVAGSLKTFSTYFFSLVFQPMTCCWKLA